MVMAVVGVSMFVIGFCLGSANELSRHAHKMLHWQTKESMRRINHATMFICTPKIKKNNT